MSHTGTCTSRCSCSPHQRLTSPRIQFAGAVGLSNCPGSPRLPFYVGRSAPIAPAPPGLTPSPTDDADTVLARMADAGFTAQDTVALLAAHSIARQKTIDPSVPGASLDSTPGKFDTKFYSEVRALFADVRCRGADTDSD